MPQNIGEWSFQKPLMPNSKKFAVKSKNGMKSRFWKSAQILTTFIFWCSQFRQIARRRMVQMIKSPRSARDIQSLPGSQETVMGRRVLVRRILRQHGWRTRHRRNDKELCSKPRKVRRKRTTPLVLIPRQLAAGKIYFLCGRRFNPQRRVFLPGFARDIKTLAHLFIAPFNSLKNSIKSLDALLLGAYSPTD